MTRSATRRRTVRLDEVDAQRLAALLARRDMTFAAWVRERIQAGAKGTGIPSEAPGGQQSDELIERPLGNV